MRNISILLVICIFALSSGCSRFHSGNSPIEIEQHENPEIWKQVYKMQSTLWPLEKKVLEIEKRVSETEKTTNKMSYDLAETKLSSRQVNKNIELLHAELQKKQSEAISPEKTAAEVARPVEKKTEKGTPKTGSAKVPGEVKKANIDTQSTIINDIKHYKVSDSQDKIMVHVNALNYPTLQTLRGARPRIVLDFFGSRLRGKEQYEILAEGNFIKKIRIRSFKEPQQKVRIVFDMVLNKKYSLERTFSKKDNIYSFDLKANQSTLHSQKD